MPEIINYKEALSNAPHLRSHTPFWVGEIHAQQYALLFVAEGGDNIQIPDSDGADGLQLHRLREERM